MQRRVHIAAMETRRVTKQIKPYENIILVIKNDSSK